MSWNSVSATSSSSFARNSCRTLTNTSAPLRPDFSSTLWIVDTRVTESPTRSGRWNCSWLPAHMRLGSATGGRNPPRLAWRSRCRPPFQCGRSSLSGPSGLRALEGEHRPAVGNHDIGALLQCLGVSAVEFGRAGGGLEQLADLRDAMLARARRLRAAFLQQLVQAHDQRRQRAQPAKGRIVDQRLQEIPVRHAAPCPLVIAALRFDQRAMQVEQVVADVLQGIEARGHGGGLLRMTPDTACKINAFFRPRAWL